MLHFSGKSNIALDVNNHRYQVTVRPSDTLLDALRERLGLAGAKPGCENGDCGACTVLLDGWPVKSCIMLAVEAVGHKVTTIEGLERTPLQKAFVEKAAFQCGYCTPGFVLVCHALLRIHPQPDDNAIESWLQSNICRCTGYQSIKDALGLVMKQGGV